MLSTLTLTQLPQLLYPFSHAYCQTRRLLLTLLPLQMDFKGVLADINERVHFRDFCESQGYLAHFRLFQTVEDYRRLGMMDRGQRARDVMRQYLNEGGDLYVPLHPMTLQRIKDTIAYGDSTPQPDLFDVAQAEATAVLQLLSFPDYMRQRHGIQQQSTPYGGFGQSPPNFDTSQLITDEPIHRAVLRMLAMPGDRLKIEVQCHLKPHPHVRPVPTLIPNLSLTLVSGRL